MTSKPRKLKTDPKTRKVQFIGQTVGHVKVLEEIDRVVSGPLYRVAFTCCGRDGTMTHKNLLRVLRTPPGDASLRCHLCVLEAHRRAQQEHARKEFFGPLPPLPKPGASIEPTRAERIAARRAENARRVAQAHQWAMGAR